VPFVTVHPAQHRHHRLRGDVVVAREPRAVGQDVRVGRNPPGLKHLLDSLLPAVGAAIARLGAERLEERLGVQVLAHLHQDARGLRERRRAVDEELAGALEDRRHIHPLEVEGKSGHFDAPADQRGPQGAREVVRGAVDAGEPHHFLGAHRDLARDRQAFGARQPPEADIRAAARHGHDPVVHDQAALRGADLDDRGAACRRARPDDRLGDVLVELQGADGRGVRGLQVVPGPARPQPFAVERPGVGKYPAFDAAYPGGGEQVRPALEHSQRAPAARVDGRVAATNHHQVAVQDALLHGPGCEQARVPGELPPKALGRRGQREDLHVRRRHHQLRGVALVEHLAGGERLHHDGPLHPVERGRGEDAVQLGGKRLRRHRPGGSGRCRGWRGRDRGRCFRRAGTECEQAGQEDGEGGEPGTQREHGHLQESGQDQGSVVSRSHCHKVTRVIDWPPATGH